MERSSEHKECNNTGCSRDCSGGAHAKECRRGECADRDDKFTVGATSKSVEADMPRRGAAGGGGDVRSRDIHSTDGRGVKDSDGDRTRWVSTSSDEYPSRREGGTLPTSAVAEGKAPRPQDVAGFGSSDRAERISDKAPRGMHVDEHSNTTGGKQPQIEHTEKFKGVTTRDVDRDGNLKGTTTKVTEKISTTIPAGMSAAEQKK